MDIETSKWDGTVELSKQSFVSDLVAVSLDITENTFNNALLLIIYKFRTTITIVQVAPSLV